MKQTLSKRPGLHISWHITDVLPQLRRQLIRTFMKGGAQRGSKRREGKSRKAFLICICISAFLLDLSVGVLAPV